MAVNIYRAGPPQKNILGGPTRLRPYYYFLFFFLDWFSWPTCFRSWANSWFYIGQAYSLAV